MTWVIYTEEIRVGKKILIRAGKLCVKKHAINLITGPNGSGKSLLLAQIFGKLSKTGAAVCVSQDNGMLLRGFGPNQNVTLSHDNQASCGRLLEDIGFFKPVSIPAENLSGGEKRILCIARGLYRCPEGGVLLIDEPTNDLDYSSVERLKHILQRYTEKLTIIMVSHDHRMETIASRIFEVRESEIAPNDRDHETLCEIWSGEGGPEEEQEKISRAADVSGKLYVQSMRGKALPLMMMLAAAFLCAVCSLGAILPEASHYAEIPSGEVILFTGNSLQGSEYLAAGAIPVPALGLMETGNNLVKRAQKLARITEEYSVITYLPDLTGSEGFTAKPVEYYNPSDGTFSDTPLEGKGSLVSCCMVSMHDGKGFTDLVNDPSIKAMSGSGCFIISRETVSFVRQVNSFTCKREAIIGELRLTLPMLILYITVTGIILFSNRVEISLYRDAAVPGKLQNSWMGKIYNRKSYTAAAALSAFAAVLLEHIFIGVEPSAGNFSCVGITIVSLCLMRKAAKTMIKMSLARAYDWRVR